ncbi:MAG: COQ9 family protein [Pseudomonadota bacterium]
MNTPNDLRRQDDHLSSARQRLIEAALPHVVFDGWSRASLSQAVQETGIDQATADLAFPRGGVDMAIGFHRMMDDALVAELDGAELARMRIRERITHAVRRRIELIAPHREAVRRAATLLALPIYTPLGMRAIWDTADRIWTACGDTATDYNWYTKRAILTSVYSATVLYWLGDDSSESAASWSFLDRRIEDVMQFEKTKAAVEKNPLARAALWGPMQVLGMVRAPRRRAESGL